jgi:hypothetical protein
VPRNAHHDDFETDLRHLMRSLNDAPALRRNRLARSLAFPGEDAQFVAALHDFVRSVLPARSRAWQAVHGEANGESHKNIAARLGISERQFYRERERARALLREALRARHYLRVVHDPAEILADELETLHAALEAGDVEWVLRRADDVLSAGLPPDLIRAFAALRACALAASGRHDAAAAALREADGADAPASDERETEFAAAYVLAAQGRHREALAHAERAAEPRTGDDVDDRGRRSAARRLCLLGNLHQEYCDPARALGVLETARQALLACAMPPQGALVAVQIDIAATRLAVPDMLDQAGDEITEAYRTAAWHDLHVQRATAEIIGELAVLSGVTAARATSRPAGAPLDVAGMRGHAAGRMHLLSSRLRSARDDSRGALRSVQAARRSIPGAHYLAKFADLREAEALLCAGEPHAALPLALAAVDGVSLGGASHYGGSAHVAAARALHLLGRTGAAREHCEAGVERMRRGALVVDLSRALRLALRLTGDVRYADAERALLLR